VHHSSVVCVNVEHGSPATYQQLWNYSTAITIVGNKIAFSVRYGLFIINTGCVTHLDVANGQVIKEIRSMPEMTGG
jgi:hypothetical protein